MYYRNQRMKATNMRTNNSYVGETIERKIRRIINNKEPIKDGAPLIYTERKDGVQAAYNIRTDRWEVALDAMDIVSKTHQAKREERQKAREEIIKDIEGGKKKIEGEA